MNIGLHGEPKILVVGATGKQGTAFIRALSQGPGEPPIFPVRILALTRNPASPKALALQKDRPWVELIRGNLDSRDSIRQVFVRAGGKGAVWGVYMVLAYAGLGESTEGEAVQGIVRITRVCAVRGGDAHWLLYSVRAWVDFGRFGDAVWRLRFRILLCSPRRNR